jgi:hypothetical protein
MPKKTLSLKDKAGLYALGSVLFLFLIPITLLIGAYVYEINLLGNFTMTMLAVAFVSFASAAYGVWFTAKAIGCLLTHSVDTVKKKSD